MNFHLSCITSQKLSWFFRKWHNQERNYRDKPIYLCNLRLEVHPRSREPKIKQSIDWTMTLSITMTQGFVVFLAFCYFACLFLAFFILYIIFESWQSGGPDDEGRIEEAIRAGPFAPCHWLANKSSHDENNVQGNDNMSSSKMHLKLTRETMATRHFHSQHPQHHSLVHIRNQNQSLDAAAHHTSTCTISTPMQTSRAGMLSPIITV